MTQVPLLKGVYVDTLPELRTSLPVNMVPVPKASGIAEGFFRPADGIVAFLSGPGSDRGAILWNNAHYRAMGTKFVKVTDIAITTIGDIEQDSVVSFDYSFDYLAIASNEKLFLYDGTVLTQVTDPDLGNVDDVIWIDGYFMFTDGESIGVTDLADPFSVNPLKYGSSEADPDPVVALLKLRNEAVAVNRNTIEFFDNVGGNLFPFARIEGAQIQKGCVGRKACCIFDDSTVAFLGSGRNENVSVYFGGNGEAVKVATHEVDLILAGYTDAELADVELEERSDGSHRFLYIHLPDRALVYDAAASADLRTPVWFILTTTVTGFAAYRARHFLLDNGTWYCGNGLQIGTLDRTISSHWGAKVRWELATPIIYNESRNAIFHELELVALTGSVALDKAPTISTSYSVDGVEWSQDRNIGVGTIGNRTKRLAWFQNGYMQSWRVQRLRGDSDAHISPIRLEAQLEGLAN